jgi:hypothetical protein
MTEPFVRAWLEPCHNRLAIGPALAAEGRDEVQIHRNSNNENAIRNRRNFMKTLTGGWF